MHVTDAVGDDKQVARVLAQQLVALHGDGLALDVEDHLVDAHPLAETLAAGGVAQADRGTPCRW